MSVSVADEARRARVQGTAAWYGEPAKRTRALMVVVDGLGTIRYVSDGATEAFGCSQKQAIGSSLLARLDSGSRRVLASAVAEVLRDATRSTECEVGLDGSGRRYGCLVLACDPSGGAPTAFVNMWEKAEASREPHSGGRLEWLQTLTEATVDVVLAVDASGERLFASGSAAAVLGVAPEALDLARLGALAHPDDRAHLLARVAACRGEPGRTECVSYRLCRPDGRTLHVETALHNRLAEAAVGALVMVTRDVGARLTDPLTALPNRVAFVARIEQAMGCQQAYAVVLVSLDRFHLVEGGLGHSQGRELLVAVADRLRASLRGGDVLGHVNREQFAVLVQGPGAADRAAALATDIQAAMDRPYKVGGRDVVATASAGIAVGRARHGSPEDVLRAAAAALHNAQRKGPSRNVMFQTMMIDAVEAQVVLDYDLREAVAREALHLHYQPIVDLTTSAVVGFEALLRWQHPTRGFVSPAEFIPLAEENGLIGVIGHWVLRQACRQLADWVRRCPEAADLVVNVNVSAEQLGGSGLLTQLDEVIRETGVSPRGIKVEVTETSLVESPEAAAAILGELRRRGFGLALDDFGTGYSSLAYLHSFPFDTVKIDKSFIHRIGGGKEHARDCALVRTILGLGRNLDMSVVAEGIETPEQFAMLRSWGCTYGQGYHIAKAMPANEAYALIAATRRAVTCRELRRADTIVVGAEVDLGS